MISQITEELVKTVLAWEMGDPRINDLGNWKDIKGITHIHVFDQSVVYKKINGAWVAQPPF